MMRVGIVNDLRMATEMLRRIVAATEGFSVAWIAMDGESAVDKHTHDHADIILMDLIMPGIDGAETTGRVMAAWPTAVLVVTATVTGNRELVFAAMGKGSLDAVCTPDLRSSEGIDEFRRKLITVSRLVKQRTVMLDLEPPPPVAVNRRGAAQGKFAVLGIGASTGGPQALATILRDIPRDIPAAIVIVQHLDLKFVPGLQKWLAQECALPIHLVGENTPVRPGVVYLAETEDHMIIRNIGDHAARLQYVEDPEDSPHRPSVDAFFRSLASLRGLPRAGVLLTGMGRDGAAGLLAMRRAEALTIAQDAASSVVYGMPRVAAEIGAVDHTTPLAQISERLVDFVVDVTLPEPGPVPYLEDSY